MDLWHSTPFAIYSLFATGLCLLLLGIDGLGGGTRVKTKTVVNNEDASTGRRQMVFAPGPIRPRTKAAPLRTPELWSDSPLSTRSTPGRASRRRSSAISPSASPT